MNILDFNLADDITIYEQEDLQDTSQEVSLGIIDVTDQGFNNLILHPGDVVILSELIVADVESLDSTLNIALTATGIDTNSKLAFVHGNEESRVQLVSDDPMHQWCEKPIAEVISSSGNAYDVYTSKDAIALIDVNLIVIHS